MGICLLSDPVSKLFVLSCLSLIHALTVLPSDSSVVPCQNKSSIHCQNFSSNIKRIF